MRQQAFGINLLRFRWLSAWNFINESL